MSSGVNPYHNARVRDRGSMHAPPTATVCDAPGRVGDGGGVVSASGGSGSDGGGSSGKRGRSGLGSARRGGSVGLEHGSW